MCINNAQVNIVNLLGLGCHSVFRCLETPCFPDRGSSFHGRGGARMLLSLALAMTERHEKAERAAIMAERGCSELEAVHIIAERIAQKR